MKHIGIMAFIFLIKMNAQNKKQQDLQAIKSMCGCYEVSFNFAETFNYSKDSTYTPSKVKHDSALEWVQLVDDNNNMVSMQHLLIVGKPENQMIIKHWRQDWLFENTDLYTYHADNKWLYKNLPKKNVVGQWTQKVFQVDDSPRYEGSASWVHVDGKSYWENTTDAPLPRREYTKRNDYNVTVRRNRHQVTNTGWIHDQDNDKVIRKEGLEDIVLAQEKGYNTYTKVDDAKCKAAQKWWKQNKKSWALVRNKWDNIFKTRSDLALKLKVDDKPLYKYFFNKDYKMKKKNISNTIDAFVIN